MPFSPTPPSFIPPEEERCCSAVAHTHRLAIHPSLQPSFRFPRHVSHWTCHPPLITLGTVFCTLPPIRLVCLASRYTPTVTPRQSSSPHDRCTSLLAMSRDSAAPPPAPCILALPPPHAAVCAGMYVRRIIVSAPSSLTFHTPAYWPPSFSLNHTTRGTFFMSESYVAFSASILGTPSIRCLHRDPRSRYSHTRFCCRSRHSRRQIGPGARAILCIPPPTHDSFCTGTPLMHTCSYCAYASGQLPSAQRCPQLSTSPAPTRPPRTAAARTKLIWSFWGVSGHTTVSIVSALLRLTHAASPCAPLS